MISLDEALQTYVEVVSVLPAETIDLTEAWGRVLAEDLSARIDLPRFNQSAMDGYALRAADTESGILTLPVSGESAAGHRPDAAMEAGTAWRIFTGAMIPAGADTVIPQERVSRDGNQIELEAAWPQACNIRFQGEELRAGAAIASCGDRLTPGLLASIANAGHLQISAHRQPRISVLITGDEVRSPQSLQHRPLDESEIPDSNGLYLRSWLQAHGYKDYSITHVADIKRDVQGAIEQATANSDLVITTGGVSVGDRDFIPQAARDCGFKEVFWRVAQKPGKPLFFGKRDDAYLLGLPGNPGAVLVGMELHARSLLNCMQGQRLPLPDWQYGRLAEAVKADSKRERLLRFCRNTDESGRNVLRPLDNQDSHMLSNLAAAGVLVRVPRRESDYAAGEVLTYIPLSG